MIARDKLALAAIALSVNRYCSAVTRSLCLLVLTLASNADKLSAMKTFTVRELDRVPNKVLDASDRDGAAKIRRRNGRTYTIRPDEGADRIKTVPNLRARLAKLFPKEIPAAQSRMVDKLLAGE